MGYEFRLPDIGEGVAEGEVVQWFVKEGDAIQEDQPLVSVLTDKANVEIPSPKTGKIARIHAAVGEKVKVGGLLVTFDVAGGGSPTAAPLVLGASPPPTTASPVRPAPPAAATNPTTPDRALATPYLRRLAAERGIDLATVKGSGPGGRITEQDLGTGSSRVPSSPTGIAPSPTAPASVGNLSASAPSSPSIPDSEIRERIPIRGIRRVIAEHMAESVHRAAHFTYVEEVDATELVRFRDRMAKHVEKQGVHLSYLPFVIKGVVAGLKAHPRLNATVDDARSELVLRSKYHIGIATATPDGLMVPVVRNADSKNLSGLAREITELAERARAGKLTREELTGSTFTITSLGALGGVLATPILNYPEVGILGVHRIVRRPIYRPDGTIGPADLMNLSVSLDHRMNDGLEGAQFLAVVKAFLEDPHQLFADVA
ncbi:MAG: dihydrolipoamide acetyltransferase family protein [Thermoplasmata archaeon]